MVTDYLERHSNWTSLSQLHLVELQPKEILSSLMQSTVFLGSPKRTIAALESSASRGRESAFAELGRWLLWGQGHTLSH